MPHENCLMFLDGTNTLRVPMMTKRMLGKMQIISTMKLVEVISEPIGKPYVIAQR